MNEAGEVCGTTLEEWEASGVVADQVLERLRTVPGHELVCARLPKPQMNGVLRGEPI